MNLAYIHSRMVAVNKAVAYGSECEEWGDFVADCFDRFGIGPWDDEAVDVTVPEEFAVYWLDVADSLQ